MATSSTISRLRAPASKEGQLPGWGWVVAIASLCWTYYLVRRELLGPLPPDEIYFAHLIWMREVGLEQFSQFYSNHLPAYFAILGSLVSLRGPTDLSFVWTLNLLNALAVIAYATMLRAASREAMWPLLPILLAFLILGRMAEIRPDTVGLLLFNLAWLVVLKGHSRRHLLLAAATCLVACLFSARAMVMTVPFAALCVVIVWQRRDIGSFASLVGLVVVAASAIGALFLLFPGWISLVLESVYLEPSKVMPEVSLAQRFLTPDRTFLSAVTALGLVGGLLTRNVAVSIPAAGQLLLLVLDPSPFQYVYGWALLPSLIGLYLLAQRRFNHPAPVIAYCGLGLTALFFAQCLAYPIIKGKNPPTGSVLRLTLDEPFGPLAAKPTDELIDMMVSGVGQERLSNQIALREEICRRVKGAVLSVFANHPICLRDARYDWIEFSWSEVWNQNATRLEKAKFASFIATARPTLFIWGSRQPAPWVADVLESYDVHGTYAIIAVEPCGQRGRPKASPACTPRDS